MKNYLIWIGGALVVVLLFWFFGSSDGIDSQNTENNTSTTTQNLPGAATNPQPKLVTKTTPKVDELTNIFPQKGNFECLYEEVTPSSRSTNVIYFSDGKMRAEFRTLGGSSNIMLYDGRSLYTWVEGQNTGTVSVPKSISDFPPIIPKDITSGKVLGAGLNNVSWDCHAWIKNASLLTKPSYVSFR